MRRLLLCLLSGPLVASLPSPLSAQSKVPYNQRVRWAAPPVALDSSTIQIRVVDVETGEPVLALVCVDLGAQIQTDSTGEARVGGLPPGNTPVVVRAPHYEPTSMIFLPGWLGRSFATVRLVRNASATATPSCRDPVEASR